MAKRRFRVTPLAVTGYLFALMGLSSAFGAGTVLGVHSTVEPNTNLLRDHGHAWVTLTEGGVTTRWGLWPDTNKRIKKLGLANGAGSDVRTNFEGDPAAGGCWNKTYKLTVAQRNAFLDYIIAQRDGVRTWTKEDNCASFARDAVAAAGQGALAVTETIVVRTYPTPRKMSQAISDAGGARNAALCPAARGSNSETCPSSCQSCNGPGLGEECTLTDFCCENCPDCEVCPCDLVSVPAVSTAGLLLAGALIWLTGCGIMLRRPKTVGRQARSEFLESGLADHSSAAR